jgi:phosphoribosylformylglycinamidine synthase
LAIAAGQWRQVALSDDEYFQIVELLGREPTSVELGMFGAMWSEHCGYKHSRPHLRKLPTEAPWVVQGPGENAGAVAIGDGLAAVFKVESHNHPSAVEPYEGAATGVGGIVRDIFTMGARPIALLDSLRFGPLTDPRNRYYLDHVVAGIGGYGNCLGIPTVGGEVFFDESYNGNPLVNAMCVGIAPVDGIVRAKASGVGNQIVLVGAETGRDGLHGATFASVDDPESSHRGVIQVGNPFLEKQLMEACLELLATDMVVAMQDLGAAGLTSSIVECASRGGVGAEIDVALVPRRETGMSAYEVMLSESQERMVLVARPEHVAAIEQVLERWSLHATVIGQITDDGRVRVLEHGEVLADVPAALYTDHCPTYEPPASESPAIAAARAGFPRALPDIAPDAVGDVLLKLLNSPNVGSRRRVYEQYDSTILTNTVVGPGQADAAVLRIKGTAKGIATAIDCNPRLCWLDPFEGARLAVAEATRNVSITGARPLGLTNCLNFGNPEKPAGAWQLKRAVEGMAAASTALGVPVVSGNVSLYNETAAAPIMPSPAIGCVGVLDDVSRHATQVWRDGDTVFLLGTGTPSLGGSEYLATVHGEVVGSPAMLDDDAERAVQELVRSLIVAGVVRTAHDCGLGGLAVALAEMAITSGAGFRDAPDLAPESASRIDEFWFGEAPSRVIVAVPPTRVEDIERAARARGVPSRRLGIAGDESFALSGTEPIPLQVLTHSWDSALEPAVPSASSCQPERV